METATTSLLLERLHFMGRETETWRRATLGRKGYGRTGAYTAPHPMPSSPSVQGGSLLDGQEHVCVKDSMVWERGACQSAPPPQEEAGDCLPPKQRALKSSRKCTNFIPLLLQVG